jgi:Ca2+-binding RTX toxin-like protein
MTMPAPFKWRADFELINAENPEGHPWLSASPDGRFSLTFFETLAGPPVHTDLEERVYNAAGASPVSIGTTFSSTTIERQPASAYLADGRRVIVWTETPSAGGGNLEDVYATVYYGNNVVAQPRFLVSGGAGTQLDPVVAASDNGFVIALNDGSVAGGRLVLKFYNIAGTLINTVTAPDAPEGVNQTGFGDYRDVEITALANGDYVVVWADHVQFDIFARVFSAGGIALSGILDVEPGGFQATFPDVTALADGRFVVTYGQFGFNIVHGRIYEADGTAVGGPFTIATNAANAFNQQVQTAALDDGRFVTVWVRTNGNIEGQVMFADGTLDGAAFTVNGDAAGNKGRPTIATLADGRFAVSWESGAGAAASIFTTIFDPREAGLNGAASSFNDDWYGTAFADTVYLGTGNDAFYSGGLGDLVFGESGNDTLFGEAGDDSLSGGAGADLLVGDIGSDSLQGGDGGDTIYGGTGGDTVYANTTAAPDGSLIADILIGEAGNDTIVGSGGDDYLYGGADNDSLTGGGGADVVIGEGGNDTLMAGAGDDYLYGGAGSNVMNGDDGLDAFISEGASDAMDGGVGRGYFYRVAAGNSQANGGSDIDIFVGGNVASNDAFFGQGGNDYGYGGDGDDLLIGGADNDVLIGQNGNDTLDGGSGTNTIWANDAGNDQVVVRIADAGNHSIEFFEAGGTNDTLRIIGSSMTSFADYQNLLANLGTAINGNLLYNTGGGLLLYLNLGASQSAIQIQGVSAYAVTSGDFVFG